MFHVKQVFDVVVLGGGHAGCEAALAASRMGCRTALVTLDRNKIAEMSCNPSIGGVGKGQLVKEIDALGGEMGRNADFTGIQFKRLNTRKGSAVQSTRCQSDKTLYAQRMREVVGRQTGLEVIEGEAKSIQSLNGQNQAEILTKGERVLIASTAIVVTSGTFMRALMHCGSQRTSGGRFGEHSSEGLSRNLADLGFEILRLKTGTPPRLLRETIDFTRMQRQPGDERPRKFSFFDSEIVLPQVDCYLTYTSTDTHEIIRQNLGRSPLYSGSIKGTGPRYCPSIEDKVVKFPQRERHQLFFEPESLSSNWIYPNGISTSLPADVQEAFVKSIAGCEHAAFARHGYAVEYDCINPKQLSHTLQSTLYEGLFFAGQVNGTSGYEEAAAQGILAGMNSALFALHRPMITLPRTQSYIGVMVDDLVTLGISEPYRMFTSRAEYRLSLREDNADLRLSAVGHAVGLLSEKSFEKVETKKQRIDAWKRWLQKTFIRFEDSSQSLSQLLKRPELSMAELLCMTEKRPEEAHLTDDEAEVLEIEVKYEGYLVIQEREISRLSRFSQTRIPETLDYQKVPGLSFEVREKLSKARPGTLSEAAVVSGVTPSALCAVLFFIQQRHDARP